MSIRTLLIEPQDVLYTRPNQDSNLYTYLETVGIKPRHPEIVERALKAAQFDVLHGRIEREAYYDAILRFHGLTVDDELVQGREAILADSSAISPTFGAIEALDALQGAGFDIVVVANAEHSSRELVEVLASADFSVDYWSGVITSFDLGQVLPDPLVMRTALELTDSAPPETAFISANASNLPLAMEQGVLTIAFRPSTEPAFVHHQVRSFVELIEILSNINDRGDTLPYFDR